MISLTCSALMSRVCTLMSFLRSPDYHSKQRMYGRPQAHFHVAPSLSYNTLQSSKRRTFRMQRPQLDEFIKRMNPESVAIIASAREAMRSNDTLYRYRQDSDFYYLTGFDEPEAIAVVTPSKEQKYTLFVRPRDPEREIWDGRRAGVEGAKREYGADEAFPINEFEEKIGDYLNGAPNLYYRIGNGNADLDET